MKVLIVYCHPSQKSYTYKIFQKLKATLESEKIEYEISNLYAMDFNTDMSESEYEREVGISDRPIPNDVLLEHKKIECAETIIFLYPVWWSDCPAKLKGWFDRVYSVGYAYKHNIYPATNNMKKIKYGLIICTSGYTLNHLREFGIEQSMRIVMMSDRLGERFNKKEMLILGGTLGLKNVDDAHHKSIISIAKKIKNNGK